MTELQKLVVKGYSIYPDREFIEMVQVFDDPNYWTYLVVEELSDEECMSCLYRLLNMYQNWNINN